MQQGLRLRNLFAFQREFISEILNLFHEDLLLTLETLYLLRLVPSELTLIHPLVLLSLCLHHLLLKGPLKLPKIDTGFLP